MATQFEEQFVVAIPVDEFDPTAGVRTSIAPISPTVSAGNIRTAFNGGAQAGGLIVGANVVGVEAMGASVANNPGWGGFEPRGKFYKAGVRLDLEAVYNGTGSIVVYFEVQSIDAANEATSGEQVSSARLQFTINYGPSNPILSISEGTFRVLSFNGDTGATVQISDTEIDLDLTAEAISAITAGSTFELVFDLQSTPRAYVNGYMVEEASGINFSAIPGSHTQSVSASFQDNPWAAAIDYLFGAETGTPPVPPDPPADVPFWTSFVKTREF